MPKIDDCVESIVNVFDDETLYKIFKCFDKSFHDQIISLQCNARGATDDINDMIENVVRGIIYNQIYNMIMESKLSLDQSDKIILNY